MVDPMAKPARPRPRGSTAVPWTTKTRKKVRIPSTRIDRTSADKEQREGSDNFCKQRTKLGHLPMQSNCARTDNLVCRCEQSSKVQTPIFREIPTDNER